MFHNIAYFCRIKSQKMQVQLYVSNQTSSDSFAMKDEIVGIPDDCVSVENFFSVLRQAVKEHYDSLWFNALKEWCVTLHIY